MQTPKSPEHIIVLEDEPTLRADLVEYLNVSGYSVAGAGSLAEYRNLSARCSPNLVLLDINLPDADGFTIAHELRALGNVGIVVLTSRGMLEDRLTGLESGADAYLVKHADLREIEATIRSVLRRLEPQTSSEAVWRYDLLSWHLHTPDGKEIKLTASEATLVSLLLETPGTPVSRDRIAATLPRPKDGSDRSIDTLVKRLRKKVVAVTSTDFPVSMVYGIGYSFTARATVTDSH